MTSKPEHKMHASRSVLVQLIPGSTKDIKTKIRRQNLRRRKNGLGEKGREKGIGIKKVGEHVTTTMIVG
jgi:hypothetical protein